MEKLETFVNRDADYGKVFDQGVKAIHAGRPDGEQCAVGDQTAKREEQAQFGTVVIQLLRLTAPRVCLGEEIILSHV